MFLDVGLALLFGLAHQTQVFVQMRTSAIIVLSSVLQVSEDEPPIGARAFAEEVMQYMLLHFKGLSRHARERGGGGKAKDAADEDETFNAGFEKFKSALQALLEVVNGCWWRKDFVLHIRGYCFIMPCFSS